MIELYGHLVYALPLWLAMCAHSLEGRMGRCDALDGGSQGLRRFYFFNCSGSRTVTCANDLGDVMRYRP